MKLLIYHVEEALSYFGKYAESERLASFISLNKWIRKV